VTGRHAEAPGERAVEEPAQGDRTRTDLAQHELRRRAQNSCHLVLDQADAHGPYLRTTSLGLATWVIPFAISFLLVEPGGRLLVPEPLFKSLMVVLSGGVGSALLVVVFRGIVPTLANGLLVGSLWLAINLALDLLIPVPMMRTSVADYFASIELRYVLIPIVAICMALTARPRA
jgi:hypothetical protein